VRCGEAVRKSVFNLLRIEPKPDFVQKIYQYNNFCFVYKDRWEKYLADKFTKLGRKIEFDQNSDFSGPPAFGDVQGS